MYASGGRERILDWCPEVTAHLVRLDDDGHVAERRYALRVSGNDRPVTVTTDELVSGDAWRARTARAKGVGTRRMREALYDIVTEQATALPETWMVRRTGWHELPDGTWTYVRPVAPEADDTGDAGGPLVQPVGIRADIARAARPLPPAGPDDVERALAAIAAHGWGPILGLSVGVRALAQSIVPVRSSLICTGVPNSGKSLSASLAVSVVLSPGWPPTVDASFSDTITAIERKIAEAGDRAVILDDMPLTADSTAGEEREATTKFDRIVRAQANDVPIRDRATRDLELRESVRVRGVPIITAQRLPPHVQASALRRVVVADFGAGDNDWRWYAAPAWPGGPTNGEALAPALRTVGDRVIAALTEAGPAGAASWVAGCDGVAQDMLCPRVRGLVGDGVPGMDGVALAAGQMLAGLVMLATACDVDPTPLIDALLPPLVDSLGNQAAQITDRQAADTAADLAIGEVLRAALYARRAHVRDAASDEPADVVPGQTRQAQGLREPDVGGPVAEQVGLYWLSGHQALGVTAKDLHTLVRASRDPRLAGRTPISLARWLLREGVTIPSHQRDCAATHKIQIGRDPNRTGKRLVLVPAHVVFELDGQGDDDDGPAPAGPEWPRPPEGPQESPSEPAGPPVPLTLVPDVADGPPAATDGPGEAPQAPQDAAALAPVPDVADGPPAATDGPGKAPQAPQDAAALAPVPDVADGPPAASDGRSGGRRGTAGERPGRAQGAGRRPGRARRRPAPPVPPPARVLAVEDGTILTTGGERHPLSPAACRDLVALLAEVGALVPAGPVTVVIGERAHRGYGLPERAPMPGEGAPRVFRGLHRAGWHRPMHPDQAPFVTRAVAMARQGRTGTVRVMPAVWVPPADFPRHMTAEMRERRELDSTDALGLARRLEAWRTAVGWDFETSSAATGVRMLRDLIERKAQRAPLWQASAGKWPTPHQFDGWRRPLTAEERASTTHVQRFDAVRAYLSATGQAIVAGDDLVWRPDPLFDEHLAGMWRIIVPHMPDDRVPPPVVGVEPGRDVWVTTAIVSLYNEIKIAPEILESWTAPAIAYSGLRDWVRHIQDVLDAPDVDQAVKGGAKLAYQATHGKLREWRQSVIKRPDWGHAIRDAAWCNVVRRTWQTAGLVKLPERVTGKGLPRRYTSSPRWPIAIRTDEIAYPAAGPDQPAPEGVELAEKPGQLGRYRAEPVLSLDEWEAAQP